MGLATVASRGRWKPYWYLALINEYLVNVEQGKIKRLIVSMPPRHGKSELISKYFSAWHLIRNPHKRVILCSYEADFAASWGRKARDITEEYGDVLNGVKVRAESSAANRWDIEGFEGGMVTAGAGGPITGRGADLFIIDDPVKNAEEANSETYREKIWDWWQSTALTRLEPNGAVVLMMTRWNTGDLAGKLLETEGDQWTVINLPAIAEEDENFCGGMYTRKVGEALCPERFPVPELVKRRAAAGSYWFGAMYQGSPIPVEGGMFKRSWFRRWMWHTDEKEFIIGKDIIRLDRCTRFMTVDPAASTKTEADYTAIGVWAVRDRDVILIDAVRARLEGPDQIKEMRRLHEKWNVRIIYVEPVAYQLTLIQHAYREGLPVREIPREDVDRDKVSRALAATPLMEAGRFWLPEFAPWLAVCEKELLTFPKGDHDDFVDMVSYACAVAYHVPKPLEDLLGEDRIRNYEPDPDIPPHALDGFISRGLDMR